MRPSRAIKTCLRGLTITAYVRAPLSRFPLLQLTLPHACSHRLLTKHIALAPATALGGQAEDSKQRLSARMDCADGEGSHPSSSSVLTSLGLGARQMKDANKKPPVSAAALAAAAAEADGKGKGAQRKLPRPGACPAAFGCLPVPMTCAPHGGNAPALASSICHVQPIVAGGVRGLLLCCLLPHVLNASIF